MQYLLPKSPFVEVGKEKQNDYQCKEEGLILQESDDLYHCTIWREKEKRERLNQLLSTRKSQLTIPIKVNKMITANVKKAMKALAWTVTLG